MRRGLALLMALTLTGAAGVVAFAGLKLYRRHAAEQSACAEVHRVEASVETARERAASQPGRRVAFLGDSYTEGQWIGGPLRAFPYVVAVDLHAAAIVNGRGGSGFVSEGPCGDQVYASRIDAVLSPQPDALVIQGGLNDTPGQSEYRAARTLLARATAVLPPSHVVLVGPPYVEQQSHAEVDRKAEELGRAARETGVGYVDLRDADLNLLGDGLHVDAASHRIIGRLVAAELEHGVDDKVSLE